VDVPVNAGARDPENVEADIRGETWPHRSKSVDHVVPGALVGRGL